jgi:hypothetical protein
MKLTFILSIFLLIGCASNNSINRISQSNVRLTGGVEGDRNWDEDLKFLRTTWFAGLTNQYDLLVAELDPKSPFNNWFSAAEKQMLERCGKVLITASRAHRNDLFTNNDLKLQLEKAAYDRKNAPVFSANLRSHSVYQLWNFNRHRVSVYCKSGLLSLKSPVNVKVPGFNTIAIY